MEEYEKVYQKDREGNKDFNKMALLDLKKANLFFAYMRTSEKLYNRERQKEKEKQEMSEIQIISESNNDSFAKRNQVLDNVSDKSLG